MNDQEIKEMNQEAGFWKRMLAVLRVENQWTFSQTLFYESTRRMDCRCKDFEQIVEIHWSRCYKDKEEKKYVKIANTGYKRGEYGRTWSII